MTSSKNPPGGLPQGGQGPGNSYTRFIPREELGAFAAWNPASLEDPGQAKPAPGQSPAGGGVYKAPFSVRAGVAGAQAEPKGVPPRAGGVPPAAPGVQVGGGPEAAAQRQAAAEAVQQPPAPDVDTLVKDARQAGYHDGYRDGLVALESFKQSQAAQMAAFMSDQVGSLVSDMHQRLESVEQQLSGRIAGVALELARQVVRSEISLRPELVVAVAEDALNTLLSSARQITVRLNPEDYALAHGVLDEQLGARGARTVSDPHVSQGGCLVESDIAVVDASVEARWSRTAAAMGLRLEWGDHPTTPVGGAINVPEGDSEWLDDMAASDASTGVER
jgi:flagellar assembly protein FliH